MLFQKTKIRRAVMKVINQKLQEAQKEHDTKLAAIKQQYAEDMKNLKERTDVAKQNLITDTVDALISKII